MASKNLGTLTIDLVAKTGGFVQGMDKAGRSSDKWRKQVEKDAKAIGTALGVGIAAGVTALTALTVATVKSANEITKFSALSGLSNEAFQKYAAGAKAVGVEQEKLADIFKDTQDEVGDFLQTGGGRLKDFFENIAPKVGVTAEQFRKLSGPEALGLYVESLEKAGASQNEFVFYMEAIANDATLLLPLLKDGAAGFNTLGEAAERAGAIMDEKTIRAAKDLDAAMWLANQSMTGMKNDIMRELTPALSDLAVMFFDVAEDGTTATAVGESLADTLRFLAKSAYGVYAAFVLAAKGIGGFVSAAQAGTQNSIFDLDYDKLSSPLEFLDDVANKVGENISGITNTVEVVVEDMNKSILDFAETLDKLDKVGTGEGRAGTLVADLADQLAKLREASRGAGVQIENDENKKAKAARKTRDVVAEQISALERAAKVWGMSADEVKIYELRTQGATESQLEYAQSLLDTVAALEEQKKLQEDYESVVKSLRTEEEARLDTLREQLAILDKMGDKENRGRAIGAAFEGAPEFQGAGDLGGFSAEFTKYDKAEEKLNEWHTKQLEMLRELREQEEVTNEEFNERELEIQRQHQEQLSQIQQARFQTGLESASKFFGELSALQNSENKKARAIGKAAAIAEATISMYTAATNSYKAMSGVPYVGPVLGAAAAAAAIAAGMANISAIKGQAHDGIMSVPNSGTWNLEKGERVLPQDTAARLDATLANIERGNGSRRGSNSPVINQTINTNGRIDKRTANQIAIDTSRQQRIASARLGTA